MLLTTVKVGFLGVRRMSDEHKGRGEEHGEHSPSRHERQGMIFWSYLSSPIAVNPGADGILDALERLSEGSDANEHIEGASHAA
jgi:hypothetical protein